LFRGDDVYKPVSALSGGERGRLALAILALEGANFLLLDEPTNHLDLPAQEMLQDVLEQFEGTILLVSHDRYLVDRLATQLWHLDDGQLHVFKGPYKEYIAEREREEQSARESNAETRARNQAKGKASRQEEYANRKRIKRLAEVEIEIAELERTFEQLGQELQEASASEAFDRVQSLGKEYTTVAERLEALLREWENLALDPTLA
jgi:ATP-binding cassette subfamily F protein 3